MKSSKHIFLAVAALLMSGHGANAQAPRMPWTVPFAARRMAFGPLPASGGRMLVRLPLEREVGIPAHIGVTDENGLWLPCRVVFTNSAGLCAEVEIHQSVASSTASLAAHFGDTILPGAVDPGPDNGPALISVYRCAGNGAPNSWDRLLYLLAKAGNPATNEFAEGVSGFSVSDEIKVISEPAARRAGRRRASRPVSGKWIIRARASVLCPQSGPYRFALAGPAPAFLFIDGTMVSQCVDRYATGDEWHVGPPLNLEAGPHSLALFLSCDRESDTIVGWQPPGAGNREGTETEILEIGPGDLLTPLEPDWTRIENRDDPPMPGYTAAIQPSYSFRGGSTVFTPVAFGLYGTVPDGALIRFSAGDGASPDLKPETPQVTHVYTAAKTYSSSLEMLDREKRFSSMAFKVDLRFVQPAEYAVRFGLGPIPCACYPEDPIEPVLIYGGSAPGKTAIRLTVDRRFRDGREESLSTNLVLTGVNQYMRLGRLKPADVEALSWSVSHAGIIITAENVLFMSPPFQAARFRVKGATLVSDTGETVVLVPDRTPAADSGPWETARPVDRIVCYDDALDAPGSSRGWLPAALAGRLPRKGAQRPPDIEVVRAPGRETDPSVAAAPLRFSGMPARLDYGTDVVVLSIGLEDALNSTPAAEYERLLAAMADMLSATRGCRVVCATIPPFRFNPGLLREYAAAVHRVASARGLPVADLYSAFHTALDRPDDGFAGGELTLSHDGRGLTARMIARVILEATGGGKTDAAR